MNEYKCTLDNSAKYGFPGLILVIIISVFASHMYIGVTFVNKSVPLVYFNELLLITLSVWMFMLQPLSVSIDDQAISINRRVKPVVIEFSDISTIRKIDNMQYTVRTFGNGGLFGFTGKYYKKGIGSMTWYCTQKKNYVLIETTSGKKIVVTPDDPEGLLNDIRQKHPLLIADEEPML